VCALTSFTHTQSQSVSVTIPSGCPGTASCKSGNLYDPVIDASSSSFLAANVAFAVAALIAIMM
jgi:hypothetical protein